MQIVVVCTGNIIRSPALAGIMQAHRPEHEWLSAAVGRKAVAGQRMRKPMREIMHAAGYGDYADAHRSRLLQDLGGRPDLIIGVAPKHLKRLEELAPDVPRILTQPAIIDPVRGGPELYLQTWKQLRQAACWLDNELPGECE